MSNEKTGKDGGTGQFQLGHRFEEVGPGLGSLYAARRADTGSPALTLLPGDRVEWQPAGEWKMRLSCQPEAPSVTLEVEQAPASARMTELADILVLMTSAIEHVEDNPRALAHLTGGRERPRARWGMRAVAGLAVLALGLGVWLHGTRAPESLSPTSPGMEAPRPSPIDAPDVLTNNDSQAAAPSYPLPSEPFRNQAKAPCRADADELEINGGCWMTLERRPPCSVTQAEYKGKCYMPVSKDRGRLPQSAQP
ncbi:hypothetical protein [Archangium sp.]|uniref:hypothetical protein n=1 Tax=Archangium sp. TaxID=1872627 RepID=UPI003899DE70